MDGELKKELVKAAVPAFVVPMVQAGVNHHFTMKQLDKQEEMAVNVAERRAQGLQAMQAGGQASRPAAGPTATVDPQMAPGDVYAELETLQAETDCSFCHSVIDSLMDAPPSEAQRGLSELQAYVREVDRIEEQDLGTTEAQQIVDDLVDRWETVPKHAAGLS